MFNSKISLEQFTHTLIETINTANMRIQTEYIAALHRQEANCPMPPPLTVKNAKISFRANLSKQGNGQHSEGLMLDFSKPNGNFHGKLVLDTREPADNEDPQDEEALPAGCAEQEPLNVSQPYATQEQLFDAAVKGEAIPPVATLY